MAKLAVIGGGSWGTALARLLAVNGHTLSLWVYESSLAEAMSRQRENSTFLPGFSLPAAIEVTSSLAKALSGCVYCLMVVPCQHLRSVAKAMLPHLPPKTMLLSASKGIENNSLLRPTQILEQVIPGNLECPLAVLSGPTFAKEIAAGLPSAAAVASADQLVAEEFQRLLTTPSLRLYVNQDLAGTELGGALKNVMAIAAGVADGLDFGLNARAALITRGLAEITRLGVSLGANPLTFQGLSGMGDLVLTCTGDLSRNRQLGLQLGQGKTLAHIQAGMKMVAEGVPTTRSAWQLARRQGVQMPITEQVYALLFENKDPHLAVQELMERELKQE